MTPSKPTSTGHSSNDSDTIGSSTDQTPMTNAETISNESESSQLSNREAGDITYLLAKLREIREKENISFYNNLALTDLIAEAWRCGFKDGHNLYK